MNDTQLDEASDGLRERGKRERLRRLHLAAAEIIRTSGYEAATTREIAQRAGVSVGTLFVYAKDKRDLLFLVINDDMDEVLEQGLANAAQHAPLADRLDGLLGPIYAYFAREPELARAALREMVHYDRPPLEPGGQARRYMQRIAKWQAGIEAVLEDASAAGALGQTAPASLVARVLFDIHLVEVRRWMTAAEPDPALGRALLRKLFAVVLPAF